MNGRETFKFTARVVPYSIEKVLEGTGISIKDVAHVVPHQANIRIIEAVAKRCGIDYSKMIVSIDRYANTSSASMPIALHDAVSSGIIKPKDKVIFVGFGAGLTYGALLVEW